MSQPTTQTDFSQERCTRPNPMLRSLLRANPTDVLHRLAIAEHYECERSSADEIHLLVPGFWCDHDITFHWNRESERLALAVVFDARMTEGRSDDIFRLLGMINEELEVGHYDYWAKTRSLVFRHAISLAGGAELRIEQAMSMVASALDAAETGYPAFQYVIWAGHTPEAALERVKEDLQGHR